MKVYTLIGKPIPLKRPRFANGHVYDSQKKEKEYDRLQLLAQKPYKIDREPIELHIVFYFKPPQRSRKYDVSHYSPPDCSNLVKYVEDICEGLFYDNDCIIYRIVAEKRYDVYPRTEFFFRRQSFYGRQEEEHKEDPPPKE